MAKNPCCRNPCFGKSIFFTYFTLAIASRSSICALFKMVRPILVCCPYTNAGSATRKVSECSEVFILVEFSFLRFVCREVRYYFFEKQKMIRFWLRRELQFFTLWRDLSLLISVCLTLKKVLILIITNDRGRSSVMASVGHQWRPNLVISRGSLKGYIGYPSSKCYQCECNCSFSIADRLFIIRYFVGFILFWKLQPHRATFSYSSESFKRIKWLIHDFLLSLFKPNDEFRNAWRCQCNVFGKSECSETIQRQYYSFQKEWKEDFYSQQEKETNSGVFFLQQYK